MLIFTVSLKNLLIALHSAINRHSWSWEEKNIRKFYKGKGRIPHLGWNNPMHKYRLGADLLGSRSLLVDNRLSVKQQYVIRARQANDMQGSIRKSTASRLQDVSAQP